MTIKSIRNFNIKSQVKTLFLKDKLTNELSFSLADRVGSIKVKVFSKTYFILPLLSRLIANEQDRSAKLILNQK
jgi:hypothetical protein